MGKSHNLLDLFSKKFSLTRRAFVKGAAAAGAAVSMYGCSKGDGEEVIYVWGGG